MASWLILGGCGFIGSNLVKFLVDMGAPYIRVVDKKLWETCPFSPEIEAAFSNPAVEFLQADVLNDALLKEAFTREGNFDFVVNLAVETQLGLAPEVYEEQVTTATLRVANKCAALKVKKFIHVSDAHVYAPSTKPSKEDAPIKPWTALAEAHFKAEEQIRRIPGLQWIILRPATVYGPGDSDGLMPRMVVGAVYADSGEQMKLMHGGDLRINTVHIKDVLGAIAWSAEKAPAKSVYNLADSSDFSVADMNKFLEDALGIKTGFLNKVANSAAKASMGAATRHVNDMHMTPWRELCIKNGCVNSTLSPYLHRELLSDNSLCIDGTAIAAAGYKYCEPRVTPVLLRQELEHAIRMKQYPPILK